MTSTDKAAFFQAIEDGNVRVVRRMIRAAPTLVDEKNERGLTPLMRAVSWMDRSPRLVQALIEAGADVNAKTADEYTALQSEPTQLCC